MRILGVSEKWPKLKKPFWTTFRLKRRDKDWQVGEVAQVVYKPRSKQREVLGIAVIAKKERRILSFSHLHGRLIGGREAIEDGFCNFIAMKYWMIKTHGSRVLKEPLNKLTMEWKERFDEQNV